MIGDVIHNLRSALDITVFGMAGHRAPKIRFPFSKKAEGLNSSIKDGYVKFAGTKVVETIHSLQPYPTGNGALYAVHALSLQDKHRLLVLTGQRAAFLVGEDHAEILKPLFRPSVAGIGLVFDGPEDTDLFTFETTYGRNFLATNFYSWECIVRVKKCHPRPPGFEK